MTEYITYMYENNVIISRFMLDHAIILLALISYDDKEMRETFQKEQTKYEDILMEAINLSVNNVTNEFLKSKILLTEFTNIMETKTCKLYKVYENKEINIKCQDFLINSKSARLNQVFDNIISIKKLNNRLLNSLNESIKILDVLYQKIGNKSVTIFFTGNFIKHLIEETSLFIYTLEFLNKNMAFTPTYIYKCKFDFNNLLKEHADYLKNMMFPLSIKNCYDVHTYIDEFHKITEEFDDNISPVVMQELNDQTRNTTKKFIDFNVQLIQNMLYNKYYASAIPLLCEHILRESNYINYQLEFFKKII